MIDTFWASGDRLGDVKVMWYIGGRVFATILCLQSQVLNPWGQELCQIPTMQLHGSIQSTLHMVWSVWDLYAETKLDVWCPIHVLGPVWSGWGGVGWEPASSTLHRRSRCQSATGALTRLTTFASFFSALLDEEHISVILTWTVLCDEKNWTQSEMGSTSPFLAQYPSTQQWEVPTRCRCGKLWWRRLVTVRRIVTDGSYNGGNPKLGSGNLPPRVWSSRRGCNSPSVNWHGGAIYP